MQIVIDIPERTYEQLKFLREQSFDGFETIIDKAVANGTPLPKGNERDAYNMGYKDGVEAYKAMMEIEKEEA